jgi:tRNA-2-methylthio-N6-dimethylallyladenosine synthase
LDEKLMNNGNLGIYPAEDRRAADRRVHVRTYGCQMNVHDSEQLANLLLHHGYCATGSLEEADLLLINTCSIRDKAEQQLYSDLGALRAWRDARSGRVLAVGGCVAQQQGDAILRRFPQVDFVFGTHNLRLVPALADAAGAGVRSARVEEVSSLDRFDYPERHPGLVDPSPGRAFVTVMEGCDLFCSFCIVPRTRGREISRPAAGIVAEAASLVSRGVREITLLGQTVNAYGRHDLRRGRADAVGTLPFASLLERLAAIPGLERLRYTSPHPIFFDDELVAAHAALAPLCPHVHLPLQSGSDAVLRRMRRRYTRDEFRRVVDRLRAARADLALTTDLIVGFPGETEQDFRDTLALVREVGFVDAYSFRYSPRPGTAAADLPDPLPVEVAQARLEELQALLRELTWAAHRSRVGELTSVLVAGPSRRGGRQLSGRDPYHRVVNFEADANSTPPGSLVPVRILAATPHSLLGRLEAAAGPAVRDREVKDRALRADELIAIQGWRP